MTLEVSAGDHTFYVNGMPENSASSIFVNNVNASAVFSASTLEMAAG